MRNKAKNHKKNFLTQCLLIFIILAFNGTLTFGSVYSQNTRFTLNLENVTIQKVFETIEDQSEFIFFYQSDLMDFNKTVSVKTKKKRVEHILDQVFKGEAVTYKIIDRQIIIKKKAKPIDQKSESSMNENTDNLEIKVPSEQQQIEVSGTVSDAQSGEPLPGVNIVVQGTTTGTTTDMNGEYTIETSADATLVFSFVGYQEQAIEINGRQEIDITMEQAVTEMEEVVAVGYGQQSKISTTGSISAVESEDIESTSSVSMGSAITGKVSGIVTISSHGQPGMSDPQMYIRGIGTMNQNNPLIVIDGVPSTMRTFMQLNPSDISNISVLKDASSTAVYGVRGANGVILVTTKEGQSGETTITAEVSYGIQKPTYLQDYLGSYKWSKAFNEAKRNDGDTENLIPQSHLKHYKEQDYPKIFPDVNWMDRSLNNAAPISRNNISIRGGTQDVTYFASIGYLKQEGLLTEFGGVTANTTYDRLNLRANLGIDITPTTEISIQSSGRLGSRKEPVRTGGNDMYIFYDNIATTAPMSAYGMEDGRFILPDGDYYHAYSRQESPIETVIGQGYFGYKENRMKVNFNFRQDMKALSPALTGLEFRTKMGYRGGYNENILKSGRGYPTHTARFNTDAVNPDPAKSDSSVVYQVSGLPKAAWYNRSYSNARRYLYLEAGLDYERSFGAHRISGLLLYTQNKDLYPNLAYPNIPTGNVGLVGRVVYDYNKQYILEFNLGYNGSENFAKEQRFGYFPSISGSWVVSKEDFLRNVSFLNHLKLRASYGIVGSDQAGNRARFIYVGDRYDRDVNRYYDYNFGNNIPDFQPGVHEASVGNEDVTWETARKQNYGVDVELFESHLSFSADYFYEYRNDILMYRQTVPGYLNIDLPPLNIGEMENEGFELNISWEDQIGDFTYRIGGNMSRAVNTVLYMDEITPPEPYQKRTGHSLNTPYGFIFDGFYTEEQVQTIEEQKAQETPPEEREVAIPWADVNPGDVKYKDLNGDGIIDSQDEKVFGYPRQPQIQGGINMSFGYKGFDLSLGFQGAAEVSRNMGGVYRDAFGGQNNEGLWAPLYKYRWTPEKAENGTAKFPRLTFQTDNYNRESSSLWNRNASYLRLKRAELGYTFKRDILPGGIQNLRVYVRGSNLYTFQKDEYKWFDPEKEAHSRISEFYPNLQIMNVGLSIEF